jgi:hypothetical protein
MELTGDLLCTTGNEQIETVRFFLNDFDEQTLIFYCCQIEKAGRFLQRAANFTDCVRLAKSICSSIGTKFGLIFYWKNESTVTLLP